LKDQEEAVASKFVRSNAAMGRNRSGYEIIWIAALSLVLSSGFAVGQGGKLDRAPDLVATAKFTRSTVIDNKWSPMNPGTRWTYEGMSVEDDGKMVPHKIVVTVTDLVKEIGGVRTVVSYELDYTDCELVEAELAFYAQDDQGNVWQFGEYPEEYEAGRFTKAPTWVHGLKGAKAGIIMQAAPQLDTPSFAQGWGPAVGWKDRGITFKIGQKVTVAAGKYDDVLVIKESAVGEQDAEQLKYYAPSIGNIRTGWTGPAGKVSETLELIKCEHLSPKELSEVRAKALNLEHTAYRRSKDVYAKTHAAVPRPVPQ
jgi:hypothetical protein